MHSTIRNEINEGAGYCFKWGVKVVASTVENGASYNGALEPRKPIDKKFLIGGTVAIVVVIILAVVLINFQKNNSIITKLQKDAYEEAFRYHDSDEKSYKKMCASCVYNNK